jgi:hypothetical protein
MSGIWNAQHLPFPRANFRSGTNETVLTALSASFTGLWGLL